MKHNLLIEIIKDPRSFDMDDRIIIGCEKMFKRHQINKKDRECVAAHPGQIHNNSKNNALRRA